MRFQGSYPAMITPFHRGVLDEESLRSLADRLIRAGSAGLVPCGSTGEAATLTPAEYKRVIAVAVEEARGRVPVIAGVGANATAKAVETAQAAAALGVDALLALVPYYNKPTQEGLFLHFREIARCVRLPIVVYNIPGRTAVNLLPATLARLAKECPNVAATKEASGSLDQVSEIVATLPAGFTVLSGDDSLAAPMMAVGARGVVSVVANILPRQSAQLCDAMLGGRLAAARRLHHQLFPVVKALFLETNPIPVKTAAGWLGLCSPELRLPLTAMSPEPRARLLAALKAAGLRPGRRSEERTVSRHSWRE
ncbi:MAG: 4-hydroxy-tetrahydrodipicolinate synthase [Elusimicrobia bacterium]|nr:4-hydroxy-tetrahydrodipicolinate synthase [Elusimicrobiota bacterium]